MLLLRSILSRFQGSGSRLHTSLAPTSMLVASQTTRVSAGAKDDTLRSQPSPASGSTRATRPLAFVSDKYIIEEKIGSGGMGVVYAARHRFTGQRVALKAIRPAYAKITEAVDRFLREAQVLALIDCPGVVRLLDCDFSECGIPFMTMELLHGHDLRAELDQHPNGRLEPRDAVNLAFEVSHALAVVHDLGILHRDIKPENIMLCASKPGVRQPKLIDFGVARLLTHTPTITKPANVLGSLHYMAPEQLRNCHEITPAADVWSMGVLLIELLGGACPLVPSNTALCPAGTTLSGGQAVPFLDALPPAPPALAAIIERCLQLNPADRYQSAGEISHALRACALDLGASVPSRFS